MLQMSGSNWYGIKGCDARLCPPASILDSAQLLL
jgi:hypothetical protein